MDRRLTGGLELCLAGVNMESMEYGERDTEDCTAVEGEPCRSKPNSGPRTQGREEKIKKSSERSKNQDARAVRDRNVVSEGRK